jgi:hypothetical protein
MKLLNKKKNIQRFWHVKLDESSSELCTFATPFGYYKFNRLPFGLSCAPEAFIKFNQKYFGDIDEHDIVIYFDDILIATETEEKHDQLLQEIMNRAKKYNVKLNIDNFQYKVKEVKFLGHIPVFNEFGVKPDADQVKTILELVDPKNVTELQRILGMINYLRDFIPNLSTIISP